MSIFHKKLTIFLFDCEIMLKSVSGNNQYLAMRVTFKFNSKEMHYGVFIFICMMNETHTRICFIYGSIYMYTRLLLHKWFSIKSYVASDLLN